MFLFERLVIFVLFISVSSTYAYKDVVSNSTLSTHLPSSDLQRSISLIMQQADLTSYFQYVDFDNVTLKGSPLATPGFIYVIPFQTSSKSDWNICLAILNDSGEILLSGVAMNAWKYSKDISYYPVIEFDQPFIYSKAVELSIGVDVLVTGVINNTEVISHQRLLFVPNRDRTKLVKIFQFEYNTVLKRDDIRGDNYAFSVNNVDKLVIEGIATGRFQNITIERERSTSISLLPLLKQKCTPTSKASSSFLIKEQSEAPFSTSYFMQHYAEEYVYNEEEESYKKLSASPVINIIGLYEKCVLPIK
ncbi:MAG: hypothetical protein ACRCVU_00605 [Flavobacterium sp.]